MKPQARERVRDITGLDAGGHVVTKGKEAIRTAYCQEHSRPTTNFLGVNEHGWIFRCSFTNEGRKEAHSFLARPDPTSPCIGGREPERPDVPA